MPIGPYVPAPPAPAKEDVGMFRRLLAGGTRMGAGVLATEGGLPGAAISGGGEGIAEMLEGDTPDPKRMAVEGAIGAVPFGRIIKAGKPVVSAIRSAGMAGVGEGGRELARGESLNPKAIATSTAIGALFGGVFGHLGGKPAEPAPAAPSYEIEPTSVKGGQTLGPGGKGVQPVRPRGPITGTEQPPTAAPVDPRTAYWEKQGLNPPAGPGRMASAQNPLPFEAPISTPPVEEGGAVPYSPATPAPYRSAAKAAQRFEDKASTDSFNGQIKAQALVDKEAQAAADEAAARKRIADAKAGLVRQDPIVTESVSSDIPGGKQRLNQRFTAPAKEDGQTSFEPNDDVEDTHSQGQGIAVLGASPSRPLRVPETQEPATRQAQVAGYKDTLYKGWIARGKSPIEANKLANAGTPFGDVPAIAPAAIEGEVVPQQGQLETPESGRDFTDTPAQPPAQPVQPEQSPLGKILTPGQKARQASYEALLAKLKGEAPPAPAEAPSAPPEPLAGPSRPPNVSMDDYMAGRSAQTGIDDESLPGDHLTGPRGTYISPEVQQLAESFKAKAAAMREQMGKPEAPVDYDQTNPPPANLVDDLDENGQELPYGGKGAVVEGVTPEEGPTSALAKFFKSRVDAAGQNYRDIKGAADVEPALTEPTLLKDARGRSMTPKNIAGAGLAREGAALGEKGVPPSPQATPVQAPAAAPTSDAPLTGQALADFFAGKGRLDLAGQQAGAPPPEVAITPAGRSQTSKAREAALAARKAKQGEQGFASPELLARAGLAGVGALAGGIAGGSMGHPLIGAALGGLGGSLGPDAIMKGFQMLGAHPDQIAQSVGDLSTPEGVKDAAHKIIGILPQWQRFSLLADAVGLPANMWAGPYGSAMMAGIEAHLSGDPRGMEVLKRLSPERFMKEWIAGRDDAQRLIQEGEMGRMEGGIAGGSKAQEIMQMPGVGMVAGDSAAKTILMEAGFTEEEAKRITLTNEPELDATRGLANLSKKSPLLQLLQPFARTPANIVEQGAHRIPGLGFITQSFRENPDPMRQQLVQQGLGLAVGAGSYALGDHMSPETAKIAGRYVSNLGGQYSLPASVGFGAGQAHHKGKDSNMAAEIANSLPLPTTAPIASWVQGNPRGMVPTALMDLFKNANPDAPSMKSLPGSLPGAHQIIR